MVWRHWTVVEDEASYDEACREYDALRHVRVAARAGEMGAAARELHEVATRLQSGNTGSDRLLQMVLDDVYWDLASLCLEADDVETARPLLEVAMHGRHGYAASKALERRGSPPEDRVRVPEASLRRPAPGPAADRFVQEAPPQVRDRLEVLHRYWAAFDRHEAFSTDGAVPWAPYTDGATGPPSELEYRDDEAAHGPLPAALSADLEALWGTCTHPDWTRRLVTSGSPGWGAATALGPAVEFWLRLDAAIRQASTFERPRTSLEGIERDLSRPLGRLMQLESPVDRALFDELSAMAVLNRRRRHYVFDDGGAHEQDSTGIERWMWEWEPDEDDEEDPGEMEDLEWTDSWTEDRRIANLAQLLAVVGSHRRRWADACLATYLQLRWRGDFRQAYLAATEGRGGPDLDEIAPTRRALVVEVANRWCGGDTAALLSTFGFQGRLPERGPRVVPLHRGRFLTLVARELEAHAPPQPLASSADRKAMTDALADLALAYLQVCEARGQRAERHDVLAWRQTWGALERYRRTQHPFEARESADDLWSRLTAVADDIAIQLRHDRP